jgi:ADP-heptose:LPS heptosyltransferase
VFIKRILLIRTDRFGEFILNIPVIKAIRQKFPLAYICVMVNPKVQELVEGNPDINEVLIYEEESMSSFFKIFGLAGEIKKKKFDLAVILNPKKDFNILTFLAGIPMRLGYNRKWGFLLTHKIDDKKYLGQKHEVEYNLDLVRRIGIDTLDKSLFIPISPDDERGVHLLLRDYDIFETTALVALHPWTSDPIKQWPIENFSQLAERLLNLSLHKVIVIGGKDEIGQSENFCKDKPSLINFTGKFSLRQLAAFLKKCSCLVSNDSGPIHMSSAVGTPVVAIFRNDMPAKSAKRWGPWGAEHVVIEKPNLKEITVIEVFEKIRGVLKK